MKLKPEYRKLLEIYPSLEDAIKENPSDFRGLVEVLNKVTQYFDRVWVCPEMLYIYDRYKTTDPLVKILCQNPDFNDAFQKACKDQWDNDVGHITVGYTIGTYNADTAHKNYIRIYKDDIEQEFV